MSLVTEKSSFSSEGSGCTLYLRFFYEKCLVSFFLGVRNGYMSVVASLLIIHKSLIIR